MPRPFSKLGKHAIERKRRHSMRCKKAELELRTWLKTWRTSVNGTPIMTSFGRDTMGPDHVKTESNCTKKPKTPEFGRSFRNLNKD